MFKESYKFITKRKMFLTAAVLVAVALSEITLTMASPLWRKYFYDVMQNKDYELFHTSLVYFIALVMGLGVSQGVKVWIAAKFSFQWREAVNEMFLSKWRKSMPKNMTTAFTDSLYLATETYVEISMEVFISASIVVGLILSNMDDTELMVSSLLYTLAATLLATLFNKPLISSDMDVQISVGGYREKLLEGNPEIRTAFGVIKRAYYKYIFVVLGFNFFSRVKGAAATLIPYLLFADSYLLGDASFGDFMGKVASFELIVINSTILVALYPKLTKARAGYNIAKKFNDDLNE